MFNKTQSGTSAGRMLGRIVLLATSFNLASQATADQFNDNGLYFGGAYGIARVDGGDFDDDNSVPQLIAGWQILPFLGIEGAYYDFGEYSGDFVDADAEGYSVALAGRLPLTSSLALFAKVGPLWWETDVDVGPFSDSFDGEELLFAAGVSMEVTENLDLRLSYDRVDWDLDADDFGDVSANEFDADFDMISLGLKLEF